MTTREYGLATHGAKQRARAAVSTGAAAEALTTPVIAGIDSDGCVVFYAAPQAAAQEAGKSQEGDGLPWGLNPCPPLSRCPTTGLRKHRKKRGHVSAGHGRVGKHRKHPSGRGNAGGQHHHRILFDKYHPGYFGKVRVVLVGAAGDQISASCGCGGTRAPLNVLPLLQSRRSLFYGIRRRSHTATCDALATIIAQVGMRHFHYSRNKYHCPIVNLDKIWSLVGEEVRFFLGGAQWRGVAVVIGELVWCGSSSRGVFYGAIAAAAQSISQAGSQQLARGKP